VSEDPHHARLDVGAGYDGGYAECPCFWGETPGSLIRVLETEISDFRGLRVLDAGCGEGKNAAYLAHQGAQVDAFDISSLAVQNGRAAFGTPHGLRWKIADIRAEPLADAAYDVVIAYGLLHCFPDEAQVAAVVRKLHKAVATDGYMIVCAFNDRITDLRAHPGFRPTFLPHGTYVDYFTSWRLMAESDEDLWESHPHNLIPHVHSMTRIVAQKRMR
jgi:tellurite methyltransferase